MVVPVVGQGVVGADPVGLAVVGREVVGADVIGLAVGGFDELEAVLAAGADVGKLVVMALDDEVVPVVVLALGFSDADPQAVASNSSPAATAEAPTPRRNVRMAAKPPRATSIVAQRPLHAWGEGPTST